MTPQKQKYLHSHNGEQFGDCHRTCIAMILDLPRDEVPHFMDGTSMEWPDDDPRWLKCEQAERDWLALRGLTPVYFGYPGEWSLNEVSRMLSIGARDTAVILGCTSSNGCNHSVVWYKGQLHNPNNSHIAGPMRSGLWVITVYAHATKPLQPSAEPATVATQETH